MDYFSHILEISRGQTVLVDLRSEGEFALGAMPFAVNIPLFNNEERAIVGTAYKQEGRQIAMQIGLEIVAGKLSALIDLFLRKAQNKKVIVHCWRGGMRSEAVEILLRSLGVSCSRLNGGYKAYRTEVLKLLDQLSTHPLLVLNGRTGSGKTQILREVAALGLPTIDFEGLANHRGSAFGDFHLNGGQPTQQNFENALAGTYYNIRNTTRILVEIEQNIGSIWMPQNVLRNIYSSEMLLIERSFEQRVERLVAEYAPHWSQNDDRVFSDRLQLLKSHIHGGVLKDISSAVQERDFPKAVSLMLQNRYDRAYDKGIAKHKQHITATYDISSGCNNLVSDLVSRLGTQ